MNSTLSWKGREASEDSVFPWSHKIVLGTLLPTSETTWLTTALSLSWMWSPAKSGTAVEFLWRWSYWWVKVFADINSGAEADREDGLGWINKLKDSRTREGLAPRRLLHDGSSPHHRSHSQCLQKKSNKTKPQHGVRITRPTEASVGHL